MLSIVLLHNVLQLDLSALGFHSSLHLFLLRRTLRTESQREAFRKSRACRAYLLLLLVLEARFYVELGISASRTVSL